MARRLWREQTGAALVEYVLLFPVVLLLFFGSLEIFRLISVQQSLRTGFQQALPCLSHWRDPAMRELTLCYPIDRIVYQVAANPFAVDLDRSSARIYVGGGDYEVVMDTLEYGDVFEAEAEITVGLGFLYPFDGGPSITLRTSAVSFVDSAPEYYALWWEHPFPADPGALP